MEKEGKDGEGEIGGSPDHPLFTLITMTNEGKADWVEFSLIS